jgi:hypothetical protein
MISNDSEDDSGSRDPVNDGGISSPGLKPLGSSNVNGKDRSVVVGFKSRLEMLARRLMNA